MRQVHLRHLRHRRLDGLDRGPSHRPRLRHTDAFLGRISGPAAQGGIGGTEAQSGFIGVTGDNDLIVNSHTFSDGDGPFNLFTAGTLPTGLVGDREYWVSDSPTDPGNRLRVHESRRDAVLRQNHVVIGDNGSGLHDVRVATSKGALVEFVRQGKTSSDLDAATDADDLV